MRQQRGRRPGVRLLAGRGATPSPANSTQGFENALCMDPSNRSLFGPTALNEEVVHFEKRKVFILVSTVMTWARSKPLDPVSSATSLSLVICAERTV